MHQQVSEPVVASDAFEVLTRAVLRHRNLSAVKCDSFGLQGLLHFDGIDSMGRPIIVVNARAAAASDIQLRPLAVKYMTQRLDPIVYAVRFFNRFISVLGDRHLHQFPWVFYVLAPWATPGFAVACMAKKSLRPCNATAFEVSCA